MGEFLRVERDTPRPGAWRLLLADPRRANALSKRLVEELQSCLRVAFESGVRAIVFDSSADRFCAGFDLTDIDRTGDADLRERFRALEQMLESVRRAPALTIAVVRGPALGAGADLVASCDYRLGTSGARFAFPGSRFGVVLGTRHLAGLVGKQHAREILVEGRTLDASAALACGMLSECCGADAFATRIDEILRRSDKLDAATLRAILRLTRENASDIDLAELELSISRDGLAQRMRAYADQAANEREVRRSAQS